MSNITRLEKELNDVLRESYVKMVNDNAKKGDLSKCTGRK